MLPPCPPCGPCQKKNVPPKSATFPGNAFAPSGEKLNRFYSLHGTRDATLDASGKRHSCREHCATCFRHFRACSRVDALAREDSGPYASS
jgi:hypothetical protein